MNERPRTDHAAFRPAQLCQFALKRRQVMGPPLRGAAAAAHIPPRKAQPGVNNREIFIDPLLLPSPYPLPLPYP